MGDATLEDGVAGIIIIKMDRVVIGGHLREHFDIFVGDHFAQVAHHAHLDLFNCDGSARRLSNISPSSGSHQVTIGRKATVIRNFITSQVQKIKL